MLLSPFRQNHSRDIQFPVNFQWELISGFCPRSKVVLTDLLKFIWPYYHPSCHHSRHTC
jgi:hypothetical protein